MGGNFVDPHSQTRKLKLSTGVDGGLSRRSIVRIPISASGNSIKETIKMVTRGKNRQFWFVDHSTANEALQVGNLTFKLLFCQNKDQFGKI